MTTDIVIGSVVGTGAQAAVNVPTLLRSGMLVQSNSGGGKSWLLRVLAEQISPIVPVIIIDPEGEFSSLRARFPFVLIGPGGDAPASVAGARLTAERLLKLRSNAVIDLFELKPADREAYVAAFVETITEAPKDLWHDTVVMVDEAHKFAPEKGDSASGDAIATAASVWRKRGKWVQLAASCVKLIEQIDQEAASESRASAAAPAELDPVLAEILAEGQTPEGSRCLVHLPPDGGWNDGARAHYERVYGRAPLCRCPAVLARLREIAERHANDEANDGADTVEVVLAALRELHQARLVEADRLLAKARDHLASAADIVASLGDDEEDISDEREFISEITAFLGWTPAAEATSPCSDPTECADGACARTLYGSQEPGQ